MIAILKDGSRWEPITRDPESSGLLRLYREGHVAGYVLSGIPDCCLDLISDRPVIIPVDCLPAGVTAFWVSRDEHGRIDTRNSFVIRDAS